MYNKVKTLFNIFRSDAKPFRRIACKLFASLPLDVGRLFGIKVLTNGFRIHVRKSSLSLGLFYDPSARRTDCEFIRSYLRDGDCYIDVGANIGTTLIPAAIAAPNGVLLGFEPHPRIFSYLQENLMLNGLANVAQIFNCALGQEKGEVIFSSLGNDDTNHVIQSGAGIRVPVSRLDEYTDYLPRINLLKIDVEGYEKYVIAGGQDTLRRTDCVYFEASHASEVVFHYSVKMLLSEFERLGFKLFVRTQHGETQLAEIDSDYKIEAHHINICAIRDINSFVDRTAWKIHKSV